MRSRTLILLLLPLLLLAVSSPSHALVEFGAGIGLVSFDDDLDGVDNDFGNTLEITVGSGAIRGMFALQSSSHDQGDYEAIMGGPAWILDAGGFSSRIYFLISAHEFENFEGAGVTVGGGIGWPLFPAASLGFDYHVSRWEDGGVNVGTGTLQMLFRIGF